MNELPKIDKLSCEESEVEIKNEILNIIKNEGKRSQIGSFILTNEAISRLQKIDSNIKNKNYILLEGPTGTSKTKTIQIYIAY